MLIVVLGGGAIGWLSWLTIGYYQNRQDILVNTTNDANVVKRFEEIDKKMTEMKNDFKQWCEKLESKFDQFIIQENILMKDLMNKNK